MRKRFWRVSVVLFLGLLALVSIVIVDANTDYGCFHTFSPTASQIGARVNIRFPASATNLKWHCVSGIIEGDEIYLKFTMVSSDLKPFTTENASYFTRDFGDPKFFFNLMSDHTINESDLVKYRTFQGNSTCGWTNLLIDMDNPGIYTVYADYRDWDQC